jgi:hypothetical protein
MRHSPFSGDKGLRGAVSEIEMGLAPSGCRVLGIGWAKTRGRVVACGCLAGKFALWVVPWVFG